MMWRTLVVVGVVVSVVVGCGPSVGGGGRGVTASCGEGARNDGSSLLAAQGTEAQVFPPLMESGFALKIPAGIYATGQAKVVRAFVDDDAGASEVGGEGLTLYLVALKGWRASAGDCYADVGGGFDLQLVLSTDPAQSVVVHDVSGDVADAEVVTAGTSERSPAPPENALFHAVFAAPHVLGEIAGVRTSLSEVGVYTNNWREGPAVGEAELDVSMGARQVATLRWPMGVPFRVLTGAPSDFSESEAQLRARFPRCPP